MPFSNKKSLSTHSSKKLQNIKVLTEYQQDPSVFTQGLYWKDGLIYQSGGGYGTSKVVVSDLKTGHSVRQRDFPSHIFAEGLTIFDNRIVLLNWKSQIIWTLDIITLDTIQQSHCPTNEGWGITNNGTELIISDGSHYLSIVDPDTWLTKRQIPVTRNLQPITMINELAYKNGKIYANIWQTDEIIVINETDGSVVETIYLPQLVMENRQCGVLNGLAWVEDVPGVTKLLVTGKNWPKRYLLDYSG